MTPIIGAIPEQMHVCVTPAQFEAVQSAHLRFTCGGDGEGLKSLLERCALTNGGYFDRDRYERGDSVHLTVFV